MKLPFGLDLKSVLVTVAVLYFVLPWLLSVMGSRRKAG